MMQATLLHDLSVILTTPPLGTTNIVASVTLTYSGLHYMGGRLSDPLEKQERADLRWYLEEYWQWPYAEFAKRGRVVEHKLAVIGKHLYNSLCESKEADRIMQAWLAAPDGQQQLSIITDIPAVLSLPWELLHDEHGFLVLRNRPISIVRRLPQSQSTQHRAAFQPPLRILLVTPRPDESGFVDPRNSARVLLDEVQPQIDAGSIAIEVLRPPTLPALRARLSNEKLPPIHILHFEGHGTFAELEGAPLTVEHSLQGKAQGLLAFENEEGELALVSADDLANVLQQSSVQFAMLNACKSAQGSSDDIFSSVAARLIRGGVDAVVAMSASVLVVSAARYSEAFYRALSVGTAIPVAHERARQALHDEPRRHLHRRRREEEGDYVRLRDWWLPHFYQQRPLVLSPAQSIRSRKNSRSPKKQPPESLPPRWNQEMPAEPRYGFSGRSRELLSIERHLLHGKLVILFGFGGVGKTALARESADWLIRTNLYGCACFHSFEHGNDASTLLSALAHLLGYYNDQYNPQNTSAALAHLRLAIKTRRPLIIADNLESILPGGNAPLPPEERTRLWDVLLALSKAGAGVLLTTRDPDLGDGRLAPSRTVAHLVLGGLWPEDAYQLALHLLGDLGIDRTRAPYSELRTLLERLDHHPLAIQLTLPALRTHSLGSILADFANLLPHFNDDNITGRNSSLLASLDYSLSRLTPEQRALLPRLAPFEGGASEDDLLTITEIDEGTWLSLRAALEQAALLTAEHVHDGIAIPFLHFHPILTPYLRSLGQLADEELHVRYARCYYGLAEYLYREDERFPQPIRALIQLELPNLRHALALFLEAGEIDVASDMVFWITKFLNYFGLTRERDEMRKRINQAVQKQAEAGRGKQSERFLTLVEYQRESSLGDDELEQGYLQTAATRFTNLLTRIEAQPADREPGQGSYEHGQTLGRLARCFLAAEQPVEAEHLLRQALTIIKELLTQDVEYISFVRRSLANLLTDLGDALRHQGRYTQAQEAYEEALEDHRRLGNIRDQVVVLGQLGILAYWQHVHETARERYQEALTYAQALGEPAMQATQWQNLGAVAEAQDQWQEAEGCYRQSLALSEGIGDVMSAAKACGALANVTARSGRFVEAEGWNKRALAVFEQAQPNGPLHASTLSNLASFLLTSIQTGSSPPARLSEAKSYAEQALKMMEPLASAAIWNPLTVLTTIAELEGQSDIARVYRRREHETFATFPGNRYHIDQVFGELIAAVAAAASGDEEAQIMVEAVLPELEQEGWQIDDVTRRIWNGERDWYLLAEGLDRGGALLVLRMLETIEEEEKDID